MWEIYERKRIVKIYSKLPKEVRRHYEIWKRVVELEGPQGLRLIKGFHDETLQGKWLGFRSSRLSRKWRVIYSVNASVLRVYVFEINAHKY